MESLYRKYRPQTFESMVGQKHIVSTLQNALADGRMAHAYLFTGPRGTGKTTTARLLAKALLCEAGQGNATAHPDGTCEQCEEIARGTHPDVYELDAASRTGVDNVRDEIINRVAFAPTQGKYKVYAIDEVHMLTTAAFNALLKTLEEPPSHVVFVLCTTDPQKIPETVLSRCQRLEFHRISDADIAERLEFVCKSEGFEYDDEALALVARHARGGLRDALSTLETLSVHGRGSVRTQDACELLGEVADDSLSGMAALVAARDVAGCFARVDEMSARGMDIEQYVRDFTRHMRNVYVAAVAGREALKDESSADEYVAQAAAFGGADRLAYILDLLAKLEDTLRNSTDQRLDFEVALTRMARPKADQSLEALAARLEALEAELAALKAGGVAVAGGAGAPASVAPAVAPARPTFGGFGQAAAVTGAQASPAAQVAPATAAPATATATQRLAAPAPQAAPVAQPSAAQAQPAVARPAAFGGQPAAASASAQPVPVRPAAFGGQPAQAAPAAPVTPAAAAASQPAALHAPDMYWPQICTQAAAIRMSIAALFKQTVGYFDESGTLVIETAGSDFTIKQLQRASSLDALRQAAQKVVGRPVNVRVQVVGAAAQAAPAQPAQPAHPVAPGQTLTPAVPAAQRQGFGAQPAANAQARPAAQQPAANAQPRPAAAQAVAPTQARPVAPQSVAPVQARPAAFQPAAQAPVQARPAAPAAQQPAPMAAPASQQRGVAPAQPASRPAAPVSQVPAPVDDAPAFEFVPDDMYDGYQDISADMPADGYGAPWDEPAAPNPAAAPVPTQPAPRSAASVSAPCPVAPAQPAAALHAVAAPASATRPAEGGEAWLSSLLENGFGAPVKITREP